jgi:vacuolar iron transporter family protein
MTGPAGADRPLSGAFPGEREGGGAPSRGAVQPEHHPDVTGGWLRAAVFGAMDGLVSNIALIAGVGGGGVAPRVVVLTGAAGLVSGAISMALGEYTSVRAQNEQIQAEVARERRELERHPEAEAEELALAWEKRGLRAELARELAETLARDPKEALRVHVQEELGVDLTAPANPWLAAGSSFACFAAGAFVPLLPYLLGATALWPALAAGGVGLFAAGALVARFTMRAWWRSGLRQLVLGGLAAGATYLIGTAIGVTVG